VGLERLEEEQEAVQRAREYAEEQELDFEASRHLLESLEAAEHEAFLASGTLSGRSRDRAIPSING
jgi:hypothetical protein